MPCSPSSDERSIWPSRGTLRSPARASARSPSGASWSGSASLPPSNGSMTGRAAAERIRKAIALINEVEDGAGDEEITPTEIAEAIRDCLELRDVDHVPNVRRYL